MREESRYEIYRKLTLQGNIFLNTFNSANSFYDKNAFAFFFASIIPFYTLDQKCRNCGYFFFNKFQAVF